jgi:hypothetical protein
MARRAIYAVRHILARNLRRVRRAQKMTQEQLANAAIAFVIVLSAYEGSPEACYA